MSSSRSRRHHEEEEHENHERWLVTYADMVTLLMVLFIVMFAMSQVDERKFMALKNGLAAGFANSASVLPGSDTLLEESGTSPLSPVAPTQTLKTLQELNQDPPADEEEAARRLAALRETQRLQKAQSEVLAALTAKGLADDVRTVIDDRGLVISLVSEHVVFHADSAVLSPRGEAVVDALAPALQALPEDLEISGHTNQVAVKPAHFATDWDLSSARAITVLRRLNELLGIPEKRLSVAAYGHTRPLIDPAKPGSQAVNKRVDIIVLAGSDEEMRKLVEQYAAATDPEATTVADSSDSTSDSTDSSGDGEIAASGTHDDEGHQS
ncbi:MAG TPA: flagellar motor protein MotB [Nocardioides sp.]|uniref:OmpA/MotB family protein n=1 Tax=uncultured Nocardioides sp. TaxID=198441 RepID=UPI000EDEC8F6|nr:flagellar motor protein MotB [uncultured Nocardioides sp.]HCB04023.1 flagellar motor protein MotB [Nocardioides sp.]HRD63586.1 flagellar motor protein MotB [Nocardioides sp.]HRI96378.1 flagellar motor protein MotB [Nocardioides sp.]